MMRSHFTYRLQDRNHCCTASAVSQQFLSTRYCTTAVGLRYLPLLYRGVTPSAVAVQERCPQLQRSTLLQSYGTPCHTSLKPRVDKNCCDTAEAVQHWFLSCKHYVKWLRIIQQYFLFYVRKIDARFKNHSHCAQRFSNSGSTSFTTSNT